MLSYRDRISVVTWVTGLLLAMQPVLVTPTWQVTWYPFGTPLTLNIDRDTFLGFWLIMVLTGGTHWTLSAWDLPKVKVRFGDGWWALPLTLGWLALRLLPYQPNPRAWLALLVGTLLVLAFTWHSVTYLATQRPAPYPAAFALRTVVFIAAGILYHWLYALGERSLLAATQMWVGTTTLMAAFWAESPLWPRQRWLYSLIGGWLIAQLAWALKQTALSPFRSGLLLLLVFYLYSSLMERAITHRLPSRVLVEYALTGGIALLLILTVAP